MKIELNKIYIDGNGDPIVIYGKKGSKFYGLDVKNHGVYVYDENGEHKFYTEYNLVCEYDNVSPDFAMQKGIILKDSQGWRVWLKAKIQGLHYPLIGMLVDDVQKQVMYKEDEKFTIAFDNEIDDYELIPSIRGLFDLYWRGKK